MEEDGHLALLLSSLISRFLRVWGGEPWECAHSVGPCKAPPGLPEKEGGGPQRGWETRTVRRKHRGQEGPGVVGPCEQSPWEGGRQRECGMEPSEGEGSPIIVQGDSVVRFPLTPLVYKE